MTHDTNSSKKESLLHLVFLAAFAIILLFAKEGVSFSNGPNWVNVSVDSTVNITNAPPEVLSVSIDNATSITLNAGATKRINCRVEIRDYNGGNTIASVNATYFDANVNISTDPDNNNSHYTNTSCTQDNVNGFYANYTCSFDVYYYANNGTSWTCNTTVQDSSGYTATGSATSTIEKLYALNVTSPLDYGDLAAGDTSANITANVTNLGNVPMNVTVHGYGATPGDGLAMNCTYGNISISYERFSTNVSANYSAKTPLASTDQQLGLQLQKQTNPATPIKGTSYWQLQVPLAPLSGTCNGTVVFTSTDPNPV
ncbi:hypothetical protein D6783_05830 [Candidatus Woesearchaeota archaeon]|nr:MAG: hypothetical protein D6783_05830 [Candidatus Woesearchaeota archaeon]